MRVNFQISVELNDDESKAVVSIGCDEIPVPMAAAMVATEHMMTAYALQSGAEFEKALTLLCEGARSNRVKMSEGISTI
jgi:hypothetical protein